MSTHVSATETWFCPLDPLSTQAKQSHSSTDYMDLFRIDAPWRQAASHVQVFKTAVGLILQLSDHDVQQMLDNLKERNIALALEAGLVPDRPTCGRGLEGYADPGSVEAVAVKLKRLGGDLKFVAMDEPLWFGHMSNSPLGCHLSITEVASGVATSIRVLQHYFPNVVIGDIEPLAVGNQPTDWLSQIAEWIVAYRAENGKNIAFFDTDTDWRRDWRPQYKILAPWLRAAGVKFGVIYDGDGDEADGRAWTQHAEERFSSLEGDPELLPDQAILQSWTPEPRFNLPDSRPGTMTSLINRYAAAETHIVLRQVDHGLQGRLTGPSEQPVPAQRLMVLAEDITNAGPPIDQTRSGTVPAEAARAVFALRINTECECSGPVDVTVGTMHYLDGERSERITRSFALPGGRDAFGGTKIVGPSGESFAFGTPPWPVTPGDHWTTQISMGASKTSAGSGYIAIIFLRADGREIKRARVDFTPAARLLGNVTTDAAGRFTFVPDASVLSVDAGFRVEFAGAPDYRLSAASIP